MAHATNPGTWPAGMRSSPLQHASQPLLLGCRVSHGIKAMDRIQVLASRLLLRLAMFNTCPMIKKRHDTIASAVTTVPGSAFSNLREAFVGRGMLLDKACDVVVHAQILDPPMMLL